MLELFGASGAGKSTIAGLLCANAQKQYPNEMVLYIDAEMAVNLEYLEKLGVDISPERFLLIQPDDGVQALQIYEDMLETGLFSTAIVDSIPALITKQELEGDVGAIHMAPLARLLSQTFKTIIQKLKQYNVAGIFINQVRANLGFGGDTATPGGNAVKFYPSVRMEVKRVGLLTKGDTNIGQTIRANLVKTRFSSPYSKADINLYYGEGIRKGEEIIEVCIDKGIITRGGAYYTFPIDDTGETNKVMGKAGVEDFLKNNQDTKDYLEKLVIESFTKKEIKEQEETEDPPEE